MIKNKLRKILVLVGIGLFISLFMISCKNSPIENAHLSAKHSKDKKHCYIILIPEEMAGSYCLQYMGDKPVLWIND